MSREILAAELTNDPLGVGYSGMNDEVAAAALNTVNRQINRDTMTGSEILNNVDASEWATRSDAQKQVVWDVCHLAEVNPFGVESTLIQNAFSGAGGVTIAALAAARKRTVSRAEELGVDARPGTIAMARNV